MCGRTTYHLIYHYTHVTYHGYSWNLNLHPDDNQDTSQDSTDGILKNFTWLLTGVRPQPHSDANYGGSLNVSPLDTNTFNVTLTPLEPLVDGSQGQPLTKQVNNHQMLND